MARKRATTNLIEPTAAAGAATVVLITDDDALATVVRRHVPAGARLETHRSADLGAGVFSPGGARLWVDLDSGLGEAIPPAGPRVYFFSRPPADPARLPPGQFIRKPLSGAAAGILWADALAGTVGRGAGKAARTGRRTRSMGKPTREQVEEHGEKWLSEFHTLDLRDLCRSCVTTLASRLGFARASLYLHDAEERLLTLADSTAEHAVPISIADVDSAHHPAAQAVRTGAIVRADDHSVAVPLRSDPCICGVLWLEGGAVEQSVDSRALCFIGRCLAHARAYDCAHREARLDCLTGLHNLRWMIDALRTEVRRAERTGTTFSVLAVDLDDLKSINDTHGHAVGDAVLRHVGGRIRSVLRDVDAAARVGGDEFVVLLPETPLDGAMLVAERVRRVVRDDAPIVAGVTLPVSASVGAAEWRPGWSIERLLDEADRGMYRAKSGARRSFEMPKLPSELPPR